MIGEMIEIRELFNSITCLIAEGTEVCPIVQILDEVLEEAKKGYALSQELIRKERDE